MVASLLHRLIVSVGPFVLSWLTDNLLQMVFDAVDEAVETALENAEQKALITPSKADDRRIATLRKYFEGWKDLKKPKLEK